MERKELGKTGVTISTCSIVDLEASIYGDVGMGSQHNWNLEEWSFLQPQGWGFKSCYLSAFFLIKKIPYGSFEN